MSGQKRIWAILHTHRQQVGEGEEINGNAILCVTDILKVAGITPPTNSRLLDYLTVHKQLFILDI